MAIITLQSKRKYKAQKHTFGPVTIPLGISYAKIRVLRNSWGTLPARAAVIRWLVEVTGLSDIGGIPQVWRLGGGAEGGDLFTMKASPIFGPAGSLVPYSEVENILPEPNNPNRVATGYMEVLLDNITVSLELETS